MTYRIYCDGRELGLDFTTLAAARAVKAVYAADWPSHHYYIRGRSRWPS